ncbi:MAG: hypothetical protein ACKVN9_07430 [Methylophilaceae bacterium]
MYSENGQLADLDEVRKVIAAADVFGVGFRLFGHRLFVDSRATEHDGPFIGAVEPLSSIQERMFWLGQNRPRFPMPERFAFFFWPNSLQLFEDAGIWQAIRARIVTTGGLSAERDADRALGDLRRLERDAARAAVTGDQHRTIWQRSASERNC